MTRLLVSVRSAQEAEAALHGGAALIDVKEPKHGSLGRAGEEVIAAVVRTVAGRGPVSAALGELADSPDMPVEPSLAYVKWGLAAAREDWRSQLGGALRRLAEQQPNCRGVAVAYADWRRADAPTPEDVCTFAVEHSLGAFLLDTWKKDSSTLLDWLALDAVARLCVRCRAAALPIALAGSLGAREIGQLRPLRPDWFAVRGAVCQGRRRTATIDEYKVRQLAAEST
ncbi:MAG TPA: (5-formylfuran-3-yl)methyl phosphate synthase [Gemmataceae bacterium]|jgi:uncharacterized protein (UPF0264 family)